MAQLGTGRYEGRIAGWKVPTTRVLRADLPVQPLNYSIGAKYGQPVPGLCPASRLHIRKDRVGAL